MNENIRGRVALVALTLFSAMMVGAVLRLFTADSPADVTVGLAMIIGAFLVSGFAMAWLAHRRNLEQHLENTSRIQEGIRKKNVGSNVDDETETPDPVWTTSTNFLRPRAWDPTELGYDSEPWS